MARPINGRFLAPQSLLQLTRDRGYNSDLVGFLLPFAMRNYEYLAYDFPTTKTLDTDFTAANGGGAAVASYITNGTQTENGTALGVTGTANNRTTSISQMKLNALAFDAARNPGMEMRHQISAITNFSIEFEYLGLAVGTEALHNISALSAAGVPTIVANTSTDQAGIILDTALTVATACVVSKGTTDAAAGGLLGTKTMVASTYTVWRVQVAQNGVYAIIDDDLQSANSLTKGPDTGVLMRPSVLVSNSGDGVSKNHLIDYLRFWAERNAS